MKRSALMVPSTMRNATSPRGEMAEIIESFTQRVGTASTGVRLHVRHPRRRGNRDMAARIAQPPFEERLGPGAHAERRQRGQRLLVTRLHEAQIACAIEPPGNLGRTDVGVLGKSLGGRVEAIGALEVAGEGGRGHGTRCRRDQ